MVTKYKCAPSGTIKTIAEKANDENSKKEAKPIHKTSKDDYYIIPDKQNPDNNTWLLKDDFNQDGTPKKTEHE